MHRFFSLVPCPGQIWHPVTFLSNGFWAHFPVEDRVATVCTTIQVTRGTGEYLLLILGLSKDLCSYKISHFSSSLVITITQKVECKFSTLPTLFHILHIFLQITYLINTYSHKTSESYIKWCLWFPLWKLILIPWLTQNVKVQTRMVFSRYINGFKLIQEKTHMDPAVLKPLFSLWKN